MNKLIAKENINIENMIYEIRGKQVMLDSDLAKLYNVETKRINEAVRNNPLKFPERFCFRIDESEYLDLKSKISTSSLKSTYGGSRKGHTVFTEQGVMMLATILKSKIAVEITIRIMDAFVLMRHYIGNNLIEQKYINNMVLEDHENIKLLQKSFDKLEMKTKINSIFYEGQIYDSYSLLLDIFNKAENEIIIVDNYAGKELLDILKSIDKKITIISKNIDKTLKNKYEKQYNNITFKNNNTFHDRFILLDNKELYHSGASFKDLGKKCFAIYKLEDKEEINYFINKISSI